MPTVTEYMPLGTGCTPIVTGPPSGAETISRLRGGGCDPGTLVITPVLHVDRHKFDASDVARVIQRCTCYLLLTTHYALHTTRSPLSTNCVLPLAPHLLLAAVYLQAELLALGVWVPLPAETAESGRFGGATPLQPWPPRTDPLAGLLSGEVPEQLSSP